MLYRIFRKIANNKVIYYLSSYFCIFNLKSKIKVSALSFVGKESTIRENSRIYSLCKITNSTIGSYTYISYNSWVNNATIGNFCSIASGVKIGMGKHPTTFVSTSPVFYSTRNALGYSFTTNNLFHEYERITIGNDVWVGTDVVILDGVNIGDGAIIAAKSLVNKDIPPYAIAGGVPAKIIKYRFDDKIIKTLADIKWWDLPGQELKLLAGYFCDVNRFAELFALKDKGPISNNRETTIEDVTKLYLNK